MKVIIPAAGYGTRMRPHTHTRPKPLVPVAGRPSLAFVLDAFEPLKIDEIIIIVGRMGEQMEEYATKHYPQYKFRFIEQKVMRGQADAIALTEPYVDGDVLTIFVDTLFEADLTVVNNLDADGAMFIAEVEDPSRFGIAVLGEDGYVKKMVEKPAKPESNLALVGLYYFKDSTALYRGIHRLMASGRSLKGEYYLADAVQEMIDAGAKFRTFPVSVWEDTGTVEATLHTNRYFLRKQDPNTEPYMRGSSLVIPPCFIADDATVENSVIGPFASISEGATVRDSVVKNSIISPDANVSTVTLFAAIIGERATVEGSYSALNVGDDSVLYAVSKADATIDETFK